MAVYVKDKDAVLDYKVDWATWLQASETISTSTFTVPAGITKDSQSNTTTTATVWLSGGTVGQEYAVINRITTNQGRTDDRTITIRVQEQ
jgi:hypothetical protein